MPTSPFRRIPFRRIVFAWLAVGMLAASCGPAGSGDVGAAESDSAEAASDDAASASPDSVLATGRFTDQGGQQTTGAYRITQTGGGDLRLALTSDFATDDGPDLHVVLTPTAPGNVSGGNAMADGAARVVGPLGAGAQSFDLPDDLDLDSFEAVLVHCVQHSHLYGSAPL
jgi:hypothetical protein